MSRLIKSVLALPVALMLIVNVSASSQALSASQSASAAQDAARSTEDDKLLALVDAYFDEQFRLNPNWATGVGIHKYDSDLEDFSRDAIENRARLAQSWLSKVEAINAKQLNQTDQLDRQLLISHIKAQILAIKDVQMWRKNPDHYTSAVTASVFDLIKRDFAPLSERMQSVISREEQIPKALEAGMSNLQPQRIPLIYAQINLEQMPGVIGFFADSVPLAFKDVQDEHLQERLKAANQAVIASLKQYEKFVNHLVQRDECKGSFAFGPELYHRKLEYDEMIDEPLDKLLEEGYAELHNQQRQFIDLAKKTSPNDGVEEYFQSISKNHPSSAKLLPSVSSVLEEIRSYCIDKNIVTIPSEERVRVEETPPFDRALTFASMDTPGPYESKAREAYYYVTVPEPTWSAERTEEHLRCYSYGDLINTSVHEAYPGHYVQFLWSKQFPTKVRKLIGCSSNEEGWAHYCEQMMLDEGLRQGDASLKMVQLHDALLRCCRYIVGIQMHTKGMTMEEAIGFFMKEGYMERANAERETKRGTVDATYLYYTLGKMRILALRDQYKKMKGADYSLKEFHDSFLRCGFAPLPIVKAELLHQPLSESASDGENQQ